MTERFERLFVWTGGAMFVASLMFCAYSYVVTWAAPFRAPFVVIGGNNDEAGGGWTAFAFNAAVLSIFAVHHSVFARDRVKTFLARAIPTRLLRSVYVWTASLLFIGACAMWQPIRFDVYQTFGMRRVLHVVVQLVGLWLIGQSVRSIRALELAGIHGQHSSSDLQTTGPYGVVRHPIYLGWVLAVFGAAHMTGDRLAFAVITTVYLVVAIPLEERSLMAAFGTKYQAYTRETRWRLLPFVY
jgi:protein-S-isoprenylcysteine O-methyltransferase Ste14